MMSEKTGHYRRTSPPSTGITIVRQVRSEELDDLGAILHRPEPPQRDRTQPDPGCPDAAGDDGCHDRPGRDHPWGDAARGDPERPEILRQTPYEMGMAAFSAPYGA